MRWAVAAVVVVSAGAAGCVGRAFQAAPALPTPARGLQPTYVEAAPDGYYVRIDCLDTDRDGTVTVSDLDSSRVPDLNLDGIVDDRDVAVLAPITIQLKKKTCLRQDVQFVITPARPSVLRCDGMPFAVVVGISGATSGQGLEKPDTGAGVRAVVQKIVSGIDGAGWQWATILATPDVAGAANVNAAAESWLEAVLAGIAQRYPCVRFALIGHSYGGVAAAAVGAELERRGHADNVAFVGLIDRVTTEYAGDGASLPVHPVILNVFQQNEQPHSGAPNGEPLSPQVPNATNWDVSRLKEPPLLHATIDNDPDVQACIAASAVTILEGSALPGCVS